MLWKIACLTGVAALRPPLPIHHSAQRICGRRSHSLYAVQQEYAQALPGGWIAGVDPSGATYYFNEHTGQSQWDPPQQQEDYAQPDEETLPEGWVMGFDPSGTAYYYNEETGASQWELPQEDVARDISSLYGKSSVLTPQLLIAAVPFLLPVLVLVGSLLRRL